MLLETDFSLQVKSLIDQYLMQCNSIPAFLSSVTLELFERQTQMMKRERLGTSIRRWTENSEQRNGSGVNRIWVYDCPLNVCFGARIKNVSDYEGSVYRGKCWVGLAPPPPPDIFIFLPRKLQNYVRIYFQPSVFVIQNHARQLYSAAL